MPHAFIRKPMTKRREPWHSGVSIIKLRICACGMAPERSGGRRNEL
jgi:hypothetical protein